MNVKPLIGFITIGLLLISNCTRSSLPGLSLELSPESKSSGVSGEVLGQAWRESVQLRGKYSAGGTISRPGYAPLGSDKKWLQVKLQISSPQRVSFLYIANDAKDIKLVCNGQAYGAHLIEYLLSGAPQADEAIQYPDIWGLTQIGNEEYHDSSGKELGGFLRVAGNLCVYHLNEGSHSLALLFYVPQNPGKCQLQLIIKK